MTATPHPTTQPKEKPAYVPPRVMRIGNLNEGAGACTAGSGVVTANCESTGANATANCNSNGTQAGTLCSMNGVTASGCDTDGNTPA